MIKKVAWFLFSATFFLSICVVKPAGASDQERPARQIAPPVVVNPGQGQARVCASLGFKPEEFMHDLPTQGNLSVDLNNFLTGKSVVSFDNQKSNVHFGDSFRLGGCKVCHGELQISLTVASGEAWNDSLHVGVAPFQLVNSAGVNLLGERIWSTSLTSVPVTGTNIRTIPLTGGQLNGLIASGKMLDVYVQDDTTVNYIKLTLWK